MLKNKQILPVIILLTIAPLVVFYQLSRCDFINYDDPAYVTENIHIQKGFTTEAIRWAFTTSHAANWHPVTWMSHMLDVRLFGLNPRWHHLTNLFFHIGNTLLLFFIFHRMTKALWKSAFVAALFALHPLHVQSVAWIAERKDVLSTLFWMLTMAAYVYYVEALRVSPADSSAIRSPSSVLRYSAVVILFALGLMAKPMLVTLPFVLLLIDYWPLQRTDKGMREVGDSGSRAVFIPLIVEKIPLLVLAILSSIITYIVQQKSGAVASIEQVTIGGRISNALVSYVIYLKKTFWPVNLAVFYPYPASRPLLLVMGAVIVLGAASFAAIRWTRKFPYFTTGWLWFTISLAPVIGIVQVGRQAIADRYTYIPLIGLFIAAAWGVPEFVKVTLPVPARKPALSILSASVLACLSIVTMKQVDFWVDGISLYDRALEVTPDNDVVRNSRGDALTRLGNLTLAISDFDKAIELNPENAEAYYNRGVTYGKLGYPERAVENFDRAIEIDPKRMEPYYNRGFAYIQIGKYGQAIENYSMAIEIDSNNAEIYNARGVAFEKLGNHLLAVEDYDRAIEIDPKQARAFNNRGFTYSRLGNYAQAIADYTSAIEIDPAYVKAYYNRGIAYAKSGLEEQAIEDMRKAARYDSQEAKTLLRSQGIDW